MRRLWRLIQLAALAHMAMTAALLVWTFTWPDRPVSSFASADAIVCLGGGIEDNGTLPYNVKTRIERCVQLYQAGLAPRVVFTDGVVANTGQIAGTEMAGYAAALGLPPEAAVIEPRAQSTLHNALFTFDLIAPADHLILVSEAFHLPRSYASFKWAAWDLGLTSPTISLSMAQPVRTDPLTGRPTGSILVREGVVWAREGLAIWFNLVRAAAFSVFPQSHENWLH